MNPSPITGIVTRLFPYREHDLIVHGLSPSAGRFSFVAPAARRSNRRFGGALATFNVVEMAVGGRRRIPTLESAALLQAFPRLSADYARFCRASYLAETAEAFAAPDQGDPDLFEALRAALTGMEAGKDSPLHFVRRLYRLLQAAGVAPVLDRCIRSGARDPEGLYRFSLKDGGLVRAGDLRPTDAADLLLELSAALLRRLLGGAARLEETDAEPIGELRFLLTRFVAFQLGRELRSPAGDPP